MRKITLIIALFFCLCAFGQNGIKDKERLLVEYCEEYEKTAMSYLLSSHETEEWIESTNDELDFLEEKIAVLIKEVTSYYLKNLYSEWDSLNTITQANNNLFMKDCPNCPEEIRLKEIEDSIILLEKIYLEHETTKKEETQY